MKSMTGYAYEELTTDEYTVSVEIKSYNSRFLDLSINLPSFLGRLENYFKDLCTKKILRGKVDVNFRIKENNSNVNVVSDVTAAKAYFEAISDVAKAIGKSANDIPLSLITSQEGVLITQKDFDIDSYIQKFLPVFEKALESFLQDRIREGKNLEKDVLKMINKIEECENIFVSWMPKMESIFKENIQKKFNELLEDKVDEQRVMTETAALLVKYTINEEVVRLKSHLDALKKEISENEAPGKKIDFICQELNREINTIGSKNQLIEVGQAVIAAKDALENIREQTRNVE